MNQEDFGVSFTGYVWIKKNDVYTFHLKSEQPSHLKVHNIHLINNDFQFTPEEQFASLKLNAGLHPISLYYQHQTTSKSPVELSISSPQQDKQTIAGDWIYSEKENASTDSDNDGLADFIELYLGTDIAMADSDEDGLMDIFETDNGQLIDTDGDGLIDAVDTDSDNDGKTDLEEGIADNDGDKILNFRDPNEKDGLTGDLDNDGLTNIIETSLLLDPENNDSDMDGLGDYWETNGGWGIDTDLDQTIDALDLDSDNDGKPDSEEGMIDIDGDEIVNFRDLNDADGPLGDLDGDSLTNTQESELTTDPNLEDSDMDNISDWVETAGGNPIDTDEDGKIDALDLDSDNDDIPDAEEGLMDLDKDGIPDYIDFYLPILSIESNEDNISISVSNGQMTVHFNESGPQTRTIIMLELSGKILFRKEMDSKQRQCILPTISETNRAILVIRTNQQSLKYLLKMD
ncbi:MAG: hypothetical protein ACI9A7_000771 [Cyclobacteriaceae bacterium]